MTIGILKRTIPANPVFHTKEHFESFFNLHLPKKMISYKVFDYY